MLESSNSEGCGWGSSLSLIIKGRYCKNIGLENIDSEIHEYLEMGIAIEPYILEININLDWEDCVEYKISTLWEEGGSGEG